MMHKLVVASLLAVALGLTPACKKADPNNWDTHIELIKDSGNRAQGFKGLESLVKSVATSKKKDAQFKAFGEKVVPAFEEIWEEAGEQQTKMLQVLLTMGHPDGAPVWNLALGLDGSSEARERTKLALQGIAKARALGSLDAVIAEFNKVVKDPKNDNDEKTAGEMRLLMATTLGKLGDKKATTALVEAMGQTVDKQPVMVHRAAADALARIADPEAAEALVTVTYRVPDIATSTNIGEKAKQALAAIGEPAVPKVLQMFKGEHQGVQALAAKHTIKQFNIQMAGAGLLGAMGRASAVDDLIAYMPKDDCVVAAEPEPDKKKAKPKEGEEEAPVDENAGNVRAVIANSLGLIGDKRAVPSLCKCAKSTKNPGDMFPIAEALGRIGGPEASACLADVIRTAEYDQEAVQNSDFVHQIRWEAARFGIHAAGADEIASIKEAIAAASTEPKVAKEMAGWAAGVTVVEECKKDKACYLDKLKDTSQDWIAREKAAIELVRMAPNDVGVATEISRAYKVRNPDARVTMTWAAATMLGNGDTKCGECSKLFTDIMKAEKDSRIDKSFQLSVLMARYTIAKLRPRAGDEAPEAAESAKE